MAHINREDLIPNYLRIRFDEEYLIDRPFLIPFLLANPSPCGSYCNTRTHHDKESPPESSETSSADSSEHDVDDGWHDDLLWMSEDPSELLRRSDAVVHQRLLKFIHNRLCTHCCKLDFLLLYSKSEEHHKSYGDIPWHYMEALDPDLKPFTGSPDGTWFIERDQPTLCLFCDLILEIHSKNRPERPDEAKKRLSPLRCQLQETTEWCEQPQSPDSVSYWTIVFFTPPELFTNLSKRVTAFRLCIYPGADEERIELTIRPRVQGRMSGPEIFCETSEHVCTGRREVAPKVPLEKVASWIQMCDTSHIHADNCLSVKYLPHFRLIDIKRRCVIEADLSYRYAALSYIWGESGQFCLTKENVRGLVETGSLSRGTQLRPVVKDAMVVSESLDIPYLWCDALCIIQDELEQKAQQIAAMDVIYTSAYLTIVAAGSERIPGLSRVSHPTVSSATNVTFSGRDYIIAEEVGPIFDRSAWATRGWTFQELLLSRRILCFTRQEVFFSCNSGTYCESVCLEDGSDVPLKGLNSTLIERFQSFKTTPISETKSPALRMSGYWKLLELLSLFVTRHLTYESDCLNAFTGILNNDQDVIGLTLWGLPIDILAKALLWTPNDFTDGYVIQRRDPFPSWSWTGWLFQGDVILEDSLEREDWRTVHVFVKLYCTTTELELVPLPTCNFTRDEIDGYNPHAVATFNAYLVGNGFRSGRSQLSPQLPPELPPLFHHHNISHLLVFSASVGTFAVSREDFGDNTYQVGYSDGKSITSISLNRCWRSKQPDVMEFVLIAETPFDHPAGGLHTMLIERIGDVHYRVAIPWLISRPEWLIGNPRTETIVLG